MTYAAKRDREPLPNASWRSPARGRDPGDRPQTEIAAMLGISRQHLYDILRERKPVSPVVAVRLGKLFGDGAGAWTKMQSAYDTWQAERREDVQRHSDDAAPRPLKVAPSWHTRADQFTSVLRTRTDRQT